ncbi:MAG TPA: hypothetical protein ENN03_11535 [bacterium]|nr:hypothetical protein [bacterium]
MEVKLENLIEQIKKEGIDSARKGADKVIRDAEKQAAAIVAEAEKKAEAKTAEAGREAEKFRQNAELAIQQAGRDTLLLVKSRLVNMLDLVFKRQIDEALSPEVLKELILKILDQWGSDEPVDIILNKKDKSRLEKLLFQGVRKSLKQDITLKISDDIEKGFRIGIKDGDVYYDFSDESLAEMLGQFLNPRIREILDSNHG